MNPTIETMSSHRSIRKFKRKIIPAKILESILSAAQCASTSSYVQAYTIIRVDKPENRHAIAEICGSQPWIIQAPVFLVFCADLNRLEIACRMHGKKMVDGYAEQFLVSTVDTALVAQNTMLAAESLGLGGVFIGAIRNDPTRVCEMLQIPKNAFPLFGMCLGYPNDKSVPKPRLPLQAILKDESYSGAGDEMLLEAYDAITRDYYRTRDSNLKDETWSQQMTCFMSKAVRPHIKSFLVSKGFLKR